MSDKPDFGEPWKSGKCNSDDQQENMCFDQEGYAPRIAAAVNACAGIPTEALTPGMVGVLMQLVREYRLHLASDVAKVFGHPEATVTVDLRVLDEILTKSGVKL